MSKLMLALLGGGVVVIVAIAGVVYFVTKEGTNTDTNNQQTNQANQNNNNSVTIKDPNGDYKLYSDSSITKQPIQDMVVGNGQLVSLEYDGSKSDAGSRLFYDLYYVDTTGAVIPMTGGPFEGDTKGVFTQNIRIFTSDAEGRPGFMEVTTVKDSGLDDNGKITGKNVKLGMYLVKFQVSE